MAYQEIDGAENEAELIAALKKQPGQTKSSDLAAVILRTFISYDGSDQRQYLSRDRTVLKALEAGNITPEAAASHLKDVGGIAAYASDYRKKMRGENTDAANDTKTRTLAALVPDVLGTDGDLALILVKLETLKGRRFHIVRKLSLPALDKETRTTLWKSFKKAVKASASGNETDHEQ